MNMAIHRYTLQTAAIVEIRCKDYDAGMVDDFIGCACIDLSEIRKETAGAVQDMWLTLCDKPREDVKHKAMRLLSLTPNAARGKVGPNNSCTCDNSKWISIHQTITN